MKTNHKYAVTLFPTHSDEVNTLGIYSTRAKAKQAQRYYQKTSPGTKVLLVCLLDYQLAKL